MKIHFVKRARINYPEAGISIGDSYYWYKPNYFPKVVSKELPVDLYMPTSTYLKQVQELIIQQRSLDLAAVTGGGLVDLINDISILRDQVETSLTKLPANLKSENNRSLAILAVRYENLSEWIEQLIELEQQFKAGKTVKDLLMEYLYEVTPYTD